MDYKRSLVVPLRVTFLMWLTFTIQYSTGLELAFLGVKPREFSGLLGIFTSPLVHGDLNHILSNTMPMLVLGSVLFYFYPRIANLVFYNCYLITGFLVWCFGREFYHIGASGVIYGIAFFLMLLGLFRKDRKSLFISILIVIAYGGLIYGLLPASPRTSWESHAFGAVVGGVHAFILRNKNQTRY